MELCLQVERFPLQASLEPGNSRPALNPLSYCGLEKKNLMVCASSKTSGQSADPCSLNRQSSVLICNTIVSRLSLCFYCI